MLDTVSLVCEVAITHRAFVRPLFAFVRWFFGVKLLVFLEEAGCDANLITLITLVQLSTVCEEFEKSAIG